MDTGDVVIGVKQENEYDVEVIGEFMSRIFNDVVYQTLVCGQSLVCGKERACTRKSQKRAGMHSEDPKASGFPQDGAY